MTETQNPFITKGYISPEYFCNREKESKEILSAIKNRRDLIIYGKRKMGKTALIQHIFHQLNKNTIKIWTDLLPSENFDDMLTLTAQAVLSAYREEDNIGKKLWTGIKNLRPTLSYDEYSGAPSISFDINSQKARVKTFSELIQLLANSSKKVVLAFDEFQQIQNYPEENVEEFLRTLLQSLPQVSVIFSGSDQHMLTGMFDNIDRPFYDFGQFMKLGPIEADAYVDFIQSHFKKKKRKIPAEEVYNILEWCNYRSFNVQMIANLLYSLRKTSITEKDVWQVKKQILQEKEDLYYTLRRIMTKAQWKVIEAFALQGKVYEPYGKEFMTRYKFSNASTIRKVIKFCQSKGLLYHSSDATADYFELDDIFMRRWIELTKGKLR